MQRSLQKRCSVASRESDRNADTQNVAAHERTRDQDLSVHPGQDVEYVVVDQRDAERLWQKTRRLWDEEPWIFRLEELVTQHDFDELVSLFEDRSMRFGKGDAEIWY